MSLFTEDANFFIIIIIFYKPETLMEDPASMMPLFGRTQYLRGAVVLTLKHTFLSVGLVSFRVAVTTSVNGPEEDTEKTAQ